MSWWRVVWALLFTTRLGTPFSLPAISNADKEAVRAALGTLPSNMVSVAARSSLGDPIVIRVHPLGGGAAKRKAKAEQNLTPFPTIFWLCCPKLKSAIGGFEKDGLVKRFEQRLAAEPESLQSMVLAHQGYAWLRWESLDSNDRALIEELSPRICSSLRDTGIAGIDFRQCGGGNVKCLHTHYAHFRGGFEDNVVGKWVHELLLAEKPGVL